uniref:RanBD1 domain-containing protein n=1 Tax=Parastrongyloides trichosuri TaxID=131310 RepID=A0A0N4ZFR8_PARTI
MSDCNNQKDRWWDVDDMADLFKDISFRDLECNYNCTKSSNQEYKSEPKEDNELEKPKNKHKKKSQLYIGIMRKCNVEDHLRSVVGIDFCFYHNFKASMTLIRYPRRLKLYYAFKNEVDFIHHSEIKYDKKKETYSFNMRPGKKTKYNSFEELVESCSEALNNTCC